MGWLFLVIILVLLSIGLYKKNDALSRAMLFIVGILVVCTIASLFFSIVWILVKLFIVVLVVIIVFNIIKNIKK